MNWRKIQLVENLVKSYLVDKDIYIRPRNIVIHLFSFANLNFEENFGIPPHNCSKIGIFSFRATRPVQLA